jgi:hypothetical protein
MTIGHPQIRCHRKGLLNVQRQSANVDADGYGDGPGLTRRRTSRRVIAPMTFTYKDRRLLVRINIFRRRYSNWAFLADHVGKDLFSLVNSSTMRRSSHN